MNEALRTIVQTLAQGRPAARAVVVASSGSVPRSAGAMMTVLDDGASFGTVGGGLVEAASQRAARDVLRRGHSALMDFDLSGQDAAALGMICGGQVKIFIEYLAPKPEQERVWGRLDQAMGRREPLVLYSFLTPDGEVTDRRLWGPDLDPGALAWLGPELATGLAPGATIPYLVDAGRGTLLVEPWLPMPALYLLGAGHVAQATAQMAALAGFQVVVMDDRAEFANRDRFPLAAEIRVIPDYHQGLPLRLGREDHVVIVTRGHLHDQEALAQALTRDPGYLGMIGSRRKRDAIYANLRAEGVSQERLNAVYSPIGLPIGAQTPAEIAVSIVAQLIAHRAGRDQA